MISALPQFVPSKVCLSCDGCCRFKDQDSRWRPKLGEGEIRQVQTALVDKIFSKDSIDADGFLKTKPCGHGYECEFFENKGNTCRIYTNRPFECQLYPYILSRHDGKEAVFVHLNCPFVQEKIDTKEFTDYVARLKTYLSQDDVLGFLRSSPALVGDYSGYEEELRYLFTINL